MSLYQKNAHKAWAILNGQRDAAEAFAKAPKTRNFWRNLSGDENAVTVDTHMLKACGADEIARKGLTTGQYGTYADAITAAALVVGETPASFQAIVWIVVRGSGE
ncbi:MAG: hypothetical protein AB7P40_19340 [Chloroflexota bacterium]